MQNQGVQTSGTGTAAFWWRLWRVAAHGARAATRNVGGRDSNLLYQIVGTAFEARISLSAVTKGSPSTRAVAPISRS
jgi:hypothetical protein